MNLHLWGCKVFRKLLPIIASLSFWLPAEESALVAAPDASAMPAVDKPSFAAAAPAKALAEESSGKTSRAANTEDDGKPLVRLVAMETDIARRYIVVVPPLPFPPFSTWRRWIHEHEKASHCILEWRNEKGEWRHGELRSMSIDKKIERYRVGTGEFPGTAYHAYGVYIFPGPAPRDVDHKGETVVVIFEEKIECDYAQVEREIRNYAAKYAQPGDPGTGGKGERNVGLGGPAYKPAQNSNTMIHYVLQACGVKISPPPLAVGWDTVPRFPYSSDVTEPAPNEQP